MDKDFKELISGYHQFREQYASGEHHHMHQLAVKGQKPTTMVVSCCDSRVDPAIVLQCQPGDLFIVRNVANIIPPYERDDKHHGTSAAMEFAINFLKIEHLIILGHSQCGGIQAAIQDDEFPSNDFISNWVSQLDKAHCHEVDELAQRSIRASYDNCMTYPWIKDKVANNALTIHQWFFNIKDAQILTCDSGSEQFKALEVPAI